MKYSELVQPDQPLPVFGMNRKAAARAVGGETVLEEMVSKQLVKPCKKRHKLTMFDVSELRAGWEKWKTLDQCPDHSEEA